MKKVYANLDRRAASTPGVVKALHILEITFDAFFDDMRQLVAEGVCANVARRISAASSQEELKAAKSSSAIREGYLKSWLKSTRPLAYESEDQVGTFQQLVRAVAPDERSAYYGLPHLTKNATVPSQLIKTLIEMSCPMELKRPGAPIVTNRVFLPTLKIAHQSILSLREESKKQDQIRFLTHMLHLAIKVFQVHFFPAALPGSGAAGCPSVKPVYNSWGNMVIRERAEQAALDMDVAPVEAMIAPEVVALNNVLAMDCNAEWYANSERGEGRACTFGVRAWARWMCACVHVWGSSRHGHGRAWGSGGHRHGCAWGSSGHGHAGIQQAQACGDPAGTGVRGSSRHGRAGIQQARACRDPAGTDGRAWGSSRHRRAMIQRAWTRACEDSASMNDGVVIPCASKRSVCKKGRNGIYLLYKPSAGRRHGIL